MDARPLSGGARQRRHEPRAVLRLGYGLNASRLRGADIVVSAGGDTLAANAAAARLLGVPNIFYGSLRRFKPEDFSLVLTSQRAMAHAPGTW